MPFSPGIERSCFKYSAVQSLTCINYRDCITVSGCQGLIYNTNYLKGLFNIDAMLVHACKNRVMPGIQMHDHIFFWALAQTKSFDLWRRSNAIHWAWKPQKHITQFVMHLMPDISISLCLMPSGEEALTLSVVDLMHKFCFFFWFLYLQYPLHRGCSALDGENHNDIIHMQPGLGNPSNAETKP